MKPQIYNVSIFFLRAGISDAGLDYQYVLFKPPNLNLIKSPKTQRLPDIVIVWKAHLLAPMPTACSLQPIRSTTGYFFYVPRLG